MERAVILLQNTTISIEEVAAMTGYGDHSNFYKAFRDYYGKAPREYMLSRGAYLIESPPSLTDGMP